MRRTSFTVSILALTVASFSAGCAAWQDLIEQIQQQTDGAGTSGGGTTGSAGAGASKGMTDGTSTGGTVGTGSGASTGSSGACTATTNADGTICKTCTDANGKVIATDCGASGSGGTRTGGSGGSGADSGAGACVKIDDGGPTSCKPAGTWKTYGADRCAQQMLELTDIAYGTSCADGSYETVTYVCCGGSSGAGATGGSNDTGATSVTCTATASPDGAICKSCVDATTGKVISTDCAGG